MDDNDESEDEHNPHKTVHHAAVVPTPPPPAPTEPTQPTPSIEEDHHRSKEPPTVPTKERVENRLSPSRSPTKASSGKLKQSTLAPAKGGSKAAVVSSSKPPTKEVSNEKSKKSPQSSTAVRPARKDGPPSPSPERPGVSSSKASKPKASKSLVANRTISGPTLAGEAVPVEIPRDTAAAPKATANTTSTTTAETTTTVSKASSPVEAPASKPSKPLPNPPSAPNLANAPDGSDDSDADSPQPCSAQAKKPTGTLSDSGSDCGSDVATRNKISEKDIESRVRQDDTLAAMEIEAAERNEHESNRKREKESADGRDMDDDYDDDHEEFGGDGDKGDNANPRVKKARFSEDGSVPNGSKCSGGKASQREAGGNSGCAKRRAPASGKDGAAKRQKNDVIEIPNDRDLLLDTKTEAFDKLRLMVINKKTGKKAERMLFDVKEMADFEGATLIKYEVSSSTLVKAINDNTPPDEDLRAKTQWSSEGVIEAYPLSANELFGGVTNDKTPDFFEKRMLDENEANHLLAATVVWKRQGDNAYSVMLRVSPMEPVKTGNPEEDTRIQLFYDGLVDLKKQNPHTELLMSIGQDFATRLIKLGNSKLFLPSMVVFCVNTHGTKIKNHIGPDIPKIKFPQFHECPKDSKISSLVITTEESQPNNGRRKKPVISKSLQADGGSTDDTATAHDPEESTASVQQHTPAGITESPAPPPPTPAKAAPAVTTTTTTTAAAAAPSASNSQQGVHETSIALYDADEKSMDIIHALGLVEKDPVGSGCKRLWFSNDNTDCVPLGNGRWIIKQLAD